MSKQRELEVKLIICLGGSHLPPIDCSLPEYDTPGILTGFAMEDLLEIPADMRTRTPRALYSVRTHQKLQPNAKFREQGVLGGDILMLSDEPDADIALPTAKVLADLAGIHVSETQRQETRTKAVLRGAIEGIPYAGKALAVLILGQKQGE